MMRALRVAFLFTAYASLAWLVDGVVTLLADDESRDVRLIERIEAREEAVEVQVDVREDFEIQVEVRTLGACAFEAERRLSVELADGATLAIEVGAGSLSVEGGEGSGVVAVGRACASSQELLDQLLLTTQADGGDLRLSAHYPDRRGRDRSGNARIDLAVSVPAGVRVDIGDSSGDIVVVGTGDLRIADSSGSIEVRGVTGSVRIADSSGGIEIDDATGDVEITDGSGEIEVRSVGGSVAVRDGSGAVEVERVGADVVIEADGGGSIDVRDVAGDFTVERDGSGGVRHSGVAGRVDVPARSRR